MKEGIVEVTVPFKDKFIHFDYLPPGSCFCVYTSFGEELQSILNFRAKTNCVLYSLDIQNDLRKLSKTDSSLNKALKSIQGQAMGEMLTSFDFFRFDQRALKEKIKENQIMRRGSSDVIFSNRS